MRRLVRLIGYTVTPLIAAFLGSLVAIYASLIASLVLDPCRAQTWCAGLEVASFLVPFLLVTIALTWLGWWLIRGPRPDDEG
jgi:hypothetical protein